MNTRRKFLSFMVTGLLLVLFVSCQTKEQQSASTSVITPVPPATLTPAPTPLPSEIQYLRDHPHAGPIPEGAIATFGRGVIADVAYAPQSKQLVIASSIGLYVYEAPNFGLIHFEPVRVGIEGKIAYLDNEKYLVVYKEEPGNMIYDPRTWELNSSLQPMQIILSADERPDDVEDKPLRFQAWNADFEIGFTDFETNETIVLKEARFARETTKLLTGSNYLVSWSTTQATLWDLPNEAPIKIFDGFSSLFTRDFQLVPSKGLMVTSSFSDRFVTVWNLDSRSIVDQYPPNSGWFWYFSPTSNEDIILVRVDDEYLITPPISELYLWDLNEGWPPVPLVESNNDLSNEISVPLDRDLALWFVYDRIPEGKFTLWDLNTRTMVSTLDIPREGWDIVGLSEDKSNLLFANSEQIVTIDVETGRVIRSVDLQLNMTQNEVIMFGSRLIREAGLLTTLSYGENGYQWLLMWDIETGQLVDQFQLNLRNGKLYDSVVLSENCILVSEIAPTDFNQSDAVVWNIVTKEQQVYTHEFGETVRHAAFYPEENLFITNTIDGPIFFWEMPDLCE